MSFMYSHAVKSFRSNVIRSNVRIISSSSTVSRYFSNISSTAINTDGKYNPSRTGILCIEFQNEFTTEGGKLHAAVKPCIDEKNTLSNALKVIETARSKGYKIFMAPITFTNDFKELGNNPYGILQGVKNGECFLASKWGGEFHDQFVPKGNDAIVLGKTGLCAFASTNLDFILRQNGIENLAICGFLTNCCVESSMRSAYELGYNVITLTDCCAATSIEAHDAAVKFTFPMFSHPMKGEDFLAKLV